MCEPPHAGPKKMTPSTDEQFAVFRFSVRDLKNVHRDFRDYFVAGSLAANGISCYRIFNILEKIHDREPEDSFMDVRQLQIVKAGIARIVEFNTLTNQFLGAIRKTFPEDRAKYAKAYAPVAKRIGSAHWAIRVRNKITHHYDMDWIENCLKHIDRNMELKFALGEKQGHSAFHFAETISILEIMRHSGEENPRKVMDKMFDFYNKSSSECIDYFHFFCSEIFERYGLASKREFVTPLGESVGKHDLPNLPLFLATNKG
jgi:hypothetical protein